MDSSGCRALEGLGHRVIISRFLGSRVKARTCDKYSSPSYNIAKIAYTKP